MRNHEEFRIVEASGEKLLDRLPEIRGRVALCVTSPPYHNAISYKSHQQDSTKNYRLREQMNYANEYLPMLARVWNQVFDALSPGGYLAINVGTVLEGGYQFPLPQDIITQLTNSEPPWNFYRSIIWNKVTAGVKRAGSVIKHQLPGYWYPNIMSEHIIIVRKPGGGGRLNRNVPSEWLENVWDLAPTPPSSIDHPAPFPEDLPHRLIRMLTKKNEIVLDPFNGSGSTTKAAIQLGRVGIGTDISRTYTEYAIERLSEASRVRSQQLLVIPIAAKDFKPGKSRGKTRHGAGR